MKGQEKGFTLLFVLIILAAGIFLTVKLLSTINQTKTSTLLPTTQAEQQNAEVKGTQISQEDLEKYLIVEAALLGVSDNISLYFKDLDGGKEVSIDSSRSFIPASTIKAFVVLEAFRQRDLGLIDFDKEITISSDNVVPTELETDEFPRLKEGTKATIYQLIEVMLIQSDNTAYNSLLDILDRRNINLALRNIGITETIVGEKLNLDEAQFQKDLQVPGRQPNTTTAKDLATFFDSLYSKKIAHSEEILSIFKRQKINNMIPVFLPQNTIVAHKTGNWAPIYNDGGVIFKPDDPFILSVFTNTGDPKIISRIAKVAYFQTADSVGQEISKDNTNLPQADNIKNSTQLITISKLPENAEVLAAETPEKFPTITASDLGITSKDLNPNDKQISDLHQALILPGSIFYNIKKFFEDRQLKNAGNVNAKVTALLNLSKSRLAEVKTLLRFGEIKKADAILQQGEDYLAKATDLAKEDPNKDLLLSEIKYVNDLHFAVLSDRAKSIPTKSKKEFIDSVYKFYQKNQKDVQPVIKSSVIANPIQQKPAIGAVSEIIGSEATLKFEDGTTKEVVLTADTKIRSFKDNKYQGVSKIKVGDRIAVIGLTNSKSKVIPQFILKDIPKELPEKHTGTVIEINPDEKTLKILDKVGQIELINIFDKTILKAKDTNVSLEGIKAGSQVIIFGATQTNLTLPTPAPSSTILPNSSSSSNLPQNTNNSSQETTGSNPPPETTQNKNQPSSQTPTIEIKATSVTVTKNSPGSQENIQSKKEEPKKQETKKAPEPPTKEKKK